MTLVVHKLAATHSGMHIGGRALNGFRALCYPRPDTIVRAGLSRFLVLDKNLHSQGVDLWNCHVVFLV